MNVLNNKLNQNWRNYQSDIDIQNPIEKKLSAKGRKRVGVIPNNLTSGRQMTFLTNKRESNFSNYNYSYMANFASQSFINYSQKKLDNYKAKVANAKNDRDRKRAQEQVDRLEKTIASKSNSTVQAKPNTKPDITPSTPKSTGVSGGDLIETNQPSDEFNKAFGNNKADKTKLNRGRKKSNPNAFSTNEANRAIDSLRQQEFDKFTPNSKKGFKETVKSVTENKKVRGGLNKLGVAAGATATGLTLYDGVNRLRSKKDDEAKYSYMDNMVEL